VHHQDINVNSHAADISLANMLPPQCFYDAAHTANVSDHLQLPHLRSHDLQPFISQPLISQPSFCWGEDVASQDDVAAFLSEASLLSLPIDFTAATFTPENVPKFQTQQLYSVWSHSSHSRKKTLCQEKEKTFLFVHGRYMSFQTCSKECTCTTYSRILHHDSYMPGKGKVSRRAPSKPSAVSCSLAKSLARGVPRSGCC
jgi:hypothetical protein